MLRKKCFLCVQLVVEGWSPWSQSRHAAHELLVEVLQTLFVLLRRLRTVQACGGQILRLILTLLRVNVELVHCSRKLVVDGSKPTL